MSKEIAELFCLPLISYIATSYLPNNLDIPSSISKMFLGAVTVILMFSTVAHYSAFGQFSTTLKEPTAEPATSAAIGQNTTNSAVEERVRIHTLVFEPDGTGWLQLNSNGTANGTVGPIISFTHDFTEANGYTIYSSVPFFANNGTIVDLNSIDFSSQITLDPSANMTLPARPTLSPAVTPDVSSLPPPSSQIEASPPTTTTQAQDPDFAQFMEIAGQCANSAMLGSTGATMSQEQCTQFLEQGQ